MQEWLRSFFLYRRYKFSDTVPKNLYMLYLFTAYAFCFVNIYLVNKLSDDLRVQLLYIRVLLHKWEIQSEQIDVIRQFLRLDTYGKMNVKTLIQREFLRCLEQGTDQDISNIKIGIKTEEPKSVTGGDTIQNED